MNTPFAVLCSALLLSLLLFGCASPPVTIESRWIVREIRGQAWYTGESEQRLRVGTRFWEGSIRTDPDSHAGLESAPYGVWIRLAGNSELHIDQLHPQPHDAPVLPTLLELRMGKMFVETSHSSQSLQITTESAAFTARNSSFVLCSSGKAGVITGEIFVSHKGTRIAVREGQVFDPDTATVVNWDSPCPSTRAMNPLQIARPAVLEVPDRHLPYYALKARGVFDPLSQQRQTSIPQGYCTPLQNAECFLRTFSCSE